MRIVEQQQCNQKSQQRAAGASPFGVNFTLCMRDCKGSCLCRRTGDPAWEAGNPRKSLFNAFAAELQRAAALCRGTGCLRKPLLNTLYVGLQRAVALCRGTGCPRKPLLLALYAGLQRAAALCRGTGCPRKPSFSLLVRRRRRPEKKNTTVEEGKGQTQQYTDALPDPCQLPADVISIAHEPEQNVTTHTINFAYLTELPRTIMHNFPGLEATMKE